MLSGLPPVNYQCMELREVLSSNRIHFEDGSGFPRKVEQKQAHRRIFATKPMIKEKNAPPKLIYICTGGKCKKHGSKQIAKLLRNYIEDHGIDEIGIIKTHCTDNCEHGPVVCLQPDNSWHFHVDEHKAIALLRAFSDR